MKSIRKFFRLNFLSGTSFFIGSMMAVNVLNFVFNAYLGRYLTLSQFGLVTFINTITYVLNIVLSGVASAVIHKIAFVNSQQGPKHASLVYMKIRKSLVKKAIIGAVVFVFLSPLFTKIFHIHTVVVMLCLAPAIIASTWGIISRSYLQGRLLFFFVGLIVILEPILKIIVAFTLLQLKLYEHVYISIPLAGVLSSISAIAIVSGITKKYTFTKEEISGKTPFPKTFFIAALITGLANNLFLTFDVLLVKHYFSPVNAGVYSLLSLVGKMIYFFGNMLTTFILPLVTADLGAKRNPTKTFNTVFNLTILIVLACVTGMTLLGETLLPYAFGNKVSMIFPYIPYYAVAIGAYTISSSILTYHLARKHYTFSAFSFLVSILLCVGIILFHSNISEVVTVILYLSILNLVSLFALHLIHSTGVEVLRIFFDFLYLFLPFPPVEKSKVSGKRILIFNWRDTKHSYSGGAEVYIHELAKRWVAKGNSVTLFCGNDQKCKRYEIIDGVRIIRRGGFNMVYVWAFLYYILRLRGKYDVVLDCENGIPFFTPLFVKEKVFCVMFHVHQKVFRETLPFYKAFVASYLEANLMPWAYRKVEFITISPSTKSDMEKIGLGKAGIHIVYPGVDTNFMTPGEKEKRPLVVSLGRLKKYKSVDVFLRTIPLVKKKIRNAKYIVAGDGEERNRLKYLARRLGIENDVTFIGKITQEEKKQLYQRAWVFANTSMMEGWAITNIEASASGTAVVAANVPGMKDSVNDGETGFLVEYGNEEELAKKIIEILQKPKLRTDMEKQSIVWAKRFEWKKSANRGLNILTV